MRKFLSLTLLLLSLNVFSQKTVDLKWHSIEVPDTLSEKVVERFDYYMRTNPINYEEDLRNIKAIKIVKADRYYVGELKEGIIYLNSKLNKFPSTKEVVILHYLAVNGGMETKDGTSAYVANDAFNITERNEGLFTKQLVRHNPYKQIVKKLKEQQPLRSKL